MSTPDNKNQKKNDNANQFDDLTRFLDEDFDTDDVDLFEFTTEEDSPLTDLKSIVLSLDWEITNETLENLANEIHRLEGEENFQADKVSLVYLQGLAKIGQYVLSEGAKTHPNAIKLLLTFYYDFEKILSSDTITGTEITALLKADVRKFKILQYQIAKRHGIEAPVPVADEARQMGLVYTDSEALRGIRAVILELDWEVTDEGLEKLTEQIEKLKQKFSDDRYIQILLQGLFTLKRYIQEEKGRAHPEAYTLLHMFSEGIARLIENRDLSEEKRQEIVIEQINALNNLKSLIASKGVHAEEAEKEAIQEVKEEEEIAAEAPAVAVTETLEEEEEELERADEDLEIAPALSGELEESEIKEETPPEELTEKLEFFFGPDEETAEVEQAEELEEHLESFFGPEEEAAAPVEEEAVAPQVEEETGPIASIDEDLEVFEEESLEEEVEMEPALAGDEAEGSEILEETPPEELSERLAFFFGPDEEVEPFEGAEPPAAEEEEEEITPALEETEEEIVPALSGEMEEAGFGVEEEQEQPPEGLSEKLEDFFGEEEPAVAEEAESPAAQAVDKGYEAMFDEEGAPAAEVTEELEEEVAFEEEPAPEIAEEKVTSGEEEAEEEELAEELFDEEVDIEPALAGDESERSEIVEEAPPDELQEKLEFFFGETEEEEKSEGEEEVLLTPALEEKEEFPPESARPMKSEEDYQTAVVEIRSHFKKQESELRKQIASMKEEIESLRAQLKS